MKNFLKKAAACCRLINKNMENNKNDLQKIEVDMPKADADLNYSDNHKVKERDYLLPGSIVIAGLLISGSWLYSATLEYLKPSDSILSQEATQELQETILPAEGVTIPVRWGDLGVKLVETGVIDLNAWENVYKNRGGTSDDIKILFSAAGDRPVKITPYNAQYFLNIFWALGLGNKNEILEKGEMADKRYGGADNFASTGGWTLAKGKAMDHYSKHSFMVLTSSQQELVEKVSRGIYRPCCGNSTHFPDCNHGMAMLGLLELMASQGISEKDMYKYALAVNAYWFPDTYLTIAKYLETKGSSWKKLDPKEILGANYSSAAGYQKILSQVAPPTQKGGGSCGV